MQVLQQAAAVVSGAAAVVSEKWSRLPDGNGATILSWPLLHLPSRRRARRRDDAPDTPVQ